MPSSTKLKLWQPVGPEVAGHRWFGRFQRGAPAMLAFRFWLSYSRLQLNQTCDCARYLNVLRTESLRPYGTLPMTGKNGYAFRCEGQLRP